MNDPHLQNPKCPDCQEQLNDKISETYLTSYPQYEGFGCKCGFKGFVQMEFSDEGKKFNEDTKDMPRKFSQGMHILNDEWIINLKNLMDAND